MVDLGQKKVDNCLPFFMQQIWGGELCDFKFNTNFNEPYSTSFNICLRSTYSINKHQTRSGELCDFKFNTNFNEPYSTFF